jgi:hypothetical protein
MPARGRLAGHTVCRLAPGGAPSILPAAALASALTVTEYEYTTAVLSTGRSSAAHRGVVILILHSPFMIPDSSASPGRWLLVHGARPVLKCAG